MAQTEARSNRSRCSTAGAELVLSGIEGFQSSDRPLGTMATARRSLKDNGFLDAAFGNEWEIVLEPGVDPAFERADSGDSFGSQQQRHTGAGR
jgi:hypothetical protein